MRLLAAGVLLAFVLFVSLHLSLSSIGMWNRYVPAAPGQSSGTVIGTPEAVRSDEWLRATPFALSQARLGYPVRNPSIGGGADPLILSLPVKHFSALFRPEQWGYLLLGAGRGFSFFWGVTVFGLFLSTFFLLLLLTENHFWLSLLGTLWLFFSAFTQWWFFTTALMLTGANLMFIGLAYLFLSRKRAAAILGAVILTTASVDFVLLLYPAFQVVLIYLLVFLLAGFFLDRRRRHFFWLGLRTRVPLAAASGIAAGAALLLVYHDARGTVAVMAGTVYPGSRISLGGSIGIARIFSGFTDAPLSAARFPAEWKNASEASNFILLFPAVLLAAGRQAIRKTGNRPLVYALGAYLAFMLIFVTTGFPVWLAKLTLMSLVPSARALLGLGAGSIFVTIIFLSGGGARPGRRFAATGSLLAMAALLVYGRELRAVAGDFFGLKYVAVIAITFSVITFLILRKSRLLFAAAILLVLIPFYGVNPLSRGMAPVYGKDVEQAALKLKQKKPASKWAVYGDYVMANYLMASGLTMVNGTKYTPDFNFLHQLDPQRKYAGIYNRMANITFSLPPAASSAGVRFALINQDSYAIEIDPCSNRLRQAGVDYFAFYGSPPGGAACLTRIDDFPASGVSFYRRKPP